jgi:peptidyl-dipeptidase Dcp
LIKLKAETFNKGYDVTELLASTLDMNWHSVENEANFKPALVLKTSAKKYGLLVNEVPTRYHTPYFAYGWWIFCRILRLGRKH